MLCDYKYSSYNNFVVLLDHCTPLKWLGMVRHACFPHHCVNQHLQGHYVLQLTRIRVPRNKCDYCIDMCASYII